MKYVIFNADDFGARPETNAAILRAHREGVLSSTSLMVTEPAAAQAAQIARENPDLAVGLHVAISDAHAALAPERIPHLASPDGRFLSDPIRAAMRYLFSSRAKIELKEEITEQFERFAALELPWDHVNGHQHLHVVPAAWDAILPLCERYDVRRVRIPFEEFAPADRERPAMRRVEMIFFRAIRRRCLRTLEGRGFFVPDRVYGQQETGNMRADYVAGLLNRLGGATNEVYLHPGTLHARPLGEGMDTDLDALLSPAVRAAVDAHRLQITTYGALCHNGKKSSEF